ncbi:MAG: regulatory protein RecX [Gammaproteobacteria bacterium]|nr:regulatory protein RecX [Gammaproteobacteria bacterium]
MSKPSPRNAAMNWLARREHSLRELRDKLAAREFEPEIIDATVAQLASEGLVSDERFAESFVAARMRKGQGPVRIRAELKKRGVSAELVQLQVDEAGHDWFALASDVRARKFGAGVPADFPGKAKQMRFLEYRGFDSEQIRAALND